MRESCRWAEIRTGPVRHPQDFRDPRWRMNACDRCERSLGQGMCGFERREDGSIRLLCLPCKILRDGPDRFNEDMDHPNLAMPRVIEVK